MSASLVKELRERTGLGLLECKKALAAANGDVDAAIEELRKSSGMKAAKKSRPHGGRRRSGYPRRRRRQLRRAGRGQQ